MFPCKKISVDLQASGSDEVDEVSLERMHQLLLAGDQLTVARAKETQRVRNNSQQAVGWLEGFTAVVEDWHAKLCLLKIWSMYQAL